MTKNILNITLVAAALILSACSGQQNNGAAVSETKENIEIKENIETKDSVETSTGAEEYSEADSSKSLNDDIEKIYLDFINENGLLSPSKEYANDDKEYIYARLQHGEYTYSEAKAAIEKIINCDMTPKYAMADINQDGVEELIIRFNAKEELYMNWVGIVTYNEGKLELVYSYEDGYRTWSTLYDSGILAVSGSWGAGAHGVNYSKFDKDFNEILLFACNEYIGSFAAQIAYDLTDTETVAKYMNDCDNALYENSVLEVTEYVSLEDKKVKISVSGYSEDVTLKAAEEKMVNGLVDMGAELISDDEMSKLCDIQAGNEVTWND